MIKRLLSIGILVFAAVGAYSQSNAELLRQAQQAGYDVSSMLGSQNNQNNRGWTQAGNNRNATMTSRDSIMRNEAAIQELLKNNPEQFQLIMKRQLMEQGKYENILNRGNLTDKQLHSIMLFQPDNLNNYELVFNEKGEIVLRQLPIVFGREIFSRENLTFAPSYNIATPVNYVLGPGDELIIEVWGGQEVFSTQKISPEGTVNIQGIGPVFVSGSTIERAQSNIASRVSEIMGQSQVKVSVGQIRSVRVNIAGEALVPGTYTLPSLATMFNAMYAAGGVNDIGSIREIGLFRNGEKVASLDVYDYLIHGKSSGSVRLQDNDHIIVSTYKNLVYMSGKVKRERVYEMKDGETLADAINYAGGFTGDAYNNSINVKRKTGRQYSILTVDSDNFGSFMLHDGDSIVVDRIIDEYSNMIAIEGAVWRPGNYEFSEKVSTLSKLIEKAEGLKGSEFGSRGQITRRKKDYTYEMIPFDIRGVVNGGMDIELHPNDEVYIPNILELREEYFIVSKGELNSPDTLKYRDGMTIEDVIVRSGGLKESASFAKIEVARRVKDPNSTVYTNKTAEVFTFSVNKDLSVAPETSRFVLNPFDEVIIRRSPGYSEQQSITISGEILYTGEYVLATAGERVSHVIKRTGGLTPEAYIRGASLWRKRTEQELAQMEAQLALINSSNGRDSLSRKSIKVDFSHSPVGIDFEKAVNNPGGNDDIILQDGDRIMVPKKNNIVRISGAVLYPNAVAYESNNVKDYISQAGGYNYNARRRPFVIYMNGKVAETKRGLFKRYPKVEPGAEVVVPVKPDRKGNGLANTMSILTSTTSMAAMAATLINATK